MEQLVESMAKCRYKSKLDMRSGFWQVGLSQRAKELCAFCIPSGRCFRPLCMMFGLQGAPGVFQELMEILASKCKQDASVRKILENGHLASFFDDTGLGSQSENDHYALLEKWFQVCLENKVRIKLSKCEFLKEEIDYLGFSIGWGKWQASKKKSTGHTQGRSPQLEGLTIIFGSHELLSSTLPQFHILFSPIDRTSQEKCQMEVGGGCTTML